MANLSVWAQRHLSRIEENFNQADKDKSGTLQLSEVIQVLRNSGFKGSDEEAKVRFLKFFFIFNLLSISSQHRIFLQNNSIFILVVSRVRLNIPYMLPWFVAEPMCTLKNRYKWRIISFSENIFRARRWQEPGRFQERV